MLRFQLEGSTGEAHNSSIAAPNAVDVFVWLAHDILNIFRIVVGHIPIYQSTIFLVVCYGKEG